MKIISTVNTFEEDVHLMEILGNVTFDLQGKTIYNSDCEIVCFWFDWLDMIEEFQVTNAKTEGAYHSIYFYIENSHQLGNLKLTIDLNHYTENESFEIDREKFFHESLVNLFELFTKLKHLESEYPLIFKSTFEKIIKLAQLVDIDLT